jgi:hypothetical protein
MTCVEVHNQLSAFLEKSLDPIRMKAIDTHLNSCPACRAEVNGLSECIRQVAALPMVDPPAGFARRVMAHVSEIEVEPRGWQRLMAALRATMPIQATAAVIVAVLAVFLYQRDPALDQPVPAPSVETPPPLPAPADQQTSSVADTAQPKAPSTRADRREARPASVAEKTAPVAQDRTAAAAAPEPEKPAENRMVARRRPTIQAQEVATGRSSFRPNADPFRFGPAVGALNQIPFRDASFAGAERSYSPLSEPRADVEFIVRRRAPDHRESEGQKEEPTGRSETDAAIAYAASKRAVPAPAAPSSAIVEMRWFGVPADRYEQFRKDLAAEAHIDSERSLSGADRESQPRSRDLLIKIIILPSDR